MNTGIVMIILTLLPGGDLSASFVNTDTLAECEQRLGRIRPILENGKMGLREAGCFRSTAEFDYFDHDPPADAPRHAFLIELESELASVRKLDAPGDCDALLAQEDGPVGKARYCATSTQAMTGVGD